MPLNDRTYLTIPELAERIGFPERTVRRWEAKGQLPVSSTRIGGRVFVQLAAVRKWEKYMSKFDGNKADKLQ